MPQEINIPIPPKPTVNRTLPQTVANVLIMLFVALVAAAATYVIEETRMKKVEAELSETQASLQNLQDTFKNIRDKQLDLPKSIQIGEGALSYKLPLDARINWVDNSNVAFTLTDVTIGNISAINALTRNSILYKTEDTIYGLVLGVKFTTPTTVYFNNCAVPELRLQGEEASDMLAPINRQFYLESGGCATNLGTTYLDQKILFKVPEGQKKFIVSTLNLPKVSFEINIDPANQISVRLLK